MTSKELTPQHECKIVVRRTLQRTLLSLTPEQSLRFRLCFAWDSIWRTVAITVCSFGAAGLVWFLCNYFLGENNVWGGWLATLTGFLGLMASGLMIGAPGEIYPTAFVLTDEGIVIEWGGQRTDVFPWKAVMRVKADQKPYMSVPANWITLKLDKKALTPAARNNHFWSCRAFWEHIPFGRYGTLRLHLEAIPAEHEREKLINTIRHQVSDDICDGLFLKMSGGVVPPSHTDIWLEKMSEHINVETLEPGHKLAGDSYEIEARLASGGQGTVYIAHATDLCEVSKLEAGQKVVIKEFILPVDGGFGARQRALSHVQAEAELLSKLSHSAVIQMYEWFVTERRAFLAIEYVEGKSLRALVEQDGKLDSARVRDLAIQMCDILSYLHSLEPPVVHRDFTPENLMLTSEGKLKLIDFNVAQQLEGNAGRTVVGKHAYIPPEQFKGKAGKESDIYAMGATLFFLLTGEDPEPISSSRPKELVEGVPSELDDLIARLTETITNKRLSDIVGIREALINCQHAQQVS